jgi:hypothetical protein
VSPRRYNHDSFKIWRPRLRPTAALGAGGMATSTEVPLGISKDYDFLPREGRKLDVRCQDCDRFFVDQSRKFGKGANVLAVFCPDCRASRRMRFATPLPAARSLVRGTGGRSLGRNVGEHPRRRSLAGRALEILQQLFESMTRYVRKTTRRRKMKPVKGFLDQ